jgi:hypothetical protein
VLSHLKTVARGSLARATPDDRVWLMLADGVSRGGTREGLLATVDSAGVLPRRLDLTVAVRQAAHLVDAEPRLGREVHVVSDLQRSALGFGRADVPRGVRVIALAPAAPAPPNRGIGAARVADGVVVVDVVGTPGAPAAALTVRVRGREIGRGLAAPGSSVSIAVPPLPPGWWVGEATLDPDELRADDERVFAWRVAPPAPVTAQAGAGPFVAAGLAVLADGLRIVPGAGVAIGDRPEAAARVSIVLPPADPALVGQVNRALAARGARWRYGAPGTPGPIVTGAAAISGILVMRRYRIEAGTGERSVTMDRDPSVLATVNGDPWLVREGGVVLVGSRLDTAWTALPTTPAFVPFLEALVNRLARGEAAIAEAEGAPRVAFHMRGADTVGATVYGLDPRESDLTPAPRDLARRLLDAAVLEEDRFAAEAFAGTGRADASGPLLLLALLLAALEWGVATLSR